MFGIRVTRLASWGILTRDTGSCPISDPDKGSPISFRGCPVLENLLAGHPYLDLFKCRSISHLLEKAWNIWVKFWEVQRFIELPFHRMGICVCLYGYGGGVANFLDV